MTRDADPATVHDGAALAALIAKLEAATEGSRELDWAIYALPKPLPRCLCAFVPYQEMVPNYTTSIDAALTLVPGEMPFIQISRFSDRWYAVGGRSSFRPNKYFGQQAATSALALCVAALKARAAQEPKP